MPLGKPRKRRKQLVPALSGSVAMLISNALVDAVRKHLDENASFSAIVQVDREIEQSIYNAVRGQSGIVVRDSVRDEVING